MTSPVYSPAFDDRGGGDPVWQAPRPPRPPLGTHPRAAPRRLPRRGRGPARERGGKGAVRALLTPLQAPRHRPPCPPPPPHQAGLGDEGVADVGVQPAAALQGDVPAVGSQHRERLARLHVEWSRPEARQDRRGLLAVAIDAPVAPAPRRRCSRGARRAAPSCTRVAAAPLCAAQASAREGMPAARLQRRGAGAARAAPRIGARPLARAGCGPCPRQGPSRGRRSPLPRRSGTGPGRTRALQKAGGHGRLFIEKRTSGLASIVRTSSETGASARAAIAGAGAALHQGRRGYDVSLVQRNRTVSPSKQCCTCCRTSTGPCTLRAPSCSRSSSGCSCRRVPCGGTAGRPSPPCRRWPHAASLGVQGAVPA